MSGSKFDEIKIKIKISGHGNWLCNVFFYLHTQMMIIYYLTVTVFTKQVGIWEYREILWRFNSIKLHRNETTSVCVFFFNININKNKKRKLPEEDGRTWNWEAPWYLLSHSSTDQDQTRMTWAPTLFRIHHWKREPPLSAEKRDSRKQAQIQSTIRSEVIREKENDPKPDWERGAKYEERSASIGTRKRKRRRRRNEMRRRVRQKEWREQRRRRPKEPFCVETVKVVKKKEWVTHALPLNFNLYLYLYLFLFIWLPLLLFRMMKCQVPP